MSYETDVALLITTIEESFSKGYLFTTINGYPLLTTVMVIEALLKDKQIKINEPPDENNPVFHVKH